MSITPRPSSASRSFSSAPSTLLRSSSVACCSSRTFSGRLELNRIASSAAETSVNGDHPHFDVDRTKPLLLAHAHGAAADELEHGDERDDRLQPVLGFEDQLDELNRAFVQSRGDGVELLLQGPGPPVDDQRPGRYAREHAVERLDQEVDVEGLLLPARLDRAYRRREGERLLLRALEKLAGDLLVGLVLLEPLAHLVLPAEELGLL